MKDVLDIIGRFLIASIFIYEAVDMIMYFNNTRQTMTDYGIHWNQDLLIVGSIIFLIIGGVLLLTGYRIKLGAFLLLLYLVPVTFIIYSFWNDPEPYKRLNAINFMKNLGIAGALLLLIAHGSGRYSIKRLLRVSSIRKSET